MSATWWFHCNNCLVRPSANGPKFYLVKCGHVLCVRCLEKAKKACDAAKQPLHCICCKKKVLNAEEIGSKMNRRTLRFFKKMEETMNEMSGEMKEIGSFQQMQINLMIKALTKKNGEKKQKSASQEKREIAEKERANQMEKAVRRAQDELRETREKYALMDTEMSVLREKLREAEAQVTAATNTRTAEQSTGVFSFKDLMHNSSTEGSIASTTTREMFLGTSAEHLNLDNALSPCITRKESVASSFFEYTDVTTPEMLGRSHSKSRSFSSRSSHEGSPNTSIYVANRLPPSRNVTPSHRAPSRTTTPKYPFTRTRSRSAARAGSVKVGSIIPIGNIPRLRTPKK